MEVYASESNAERSFLYYWTILNTLGFDPTPEHQFDLTRKWRFDFAFIPHKVAIEIDGGVYLGGRHVQPKGFQKDCEKINKAIELGWRVLRYTPQMLRGDPISVIQQIEKVIRSQA